MDFVSRVESKNTGPTRFVSCQDSVHDRQQFMGQSLTGGCPFSLLFRLSMLP